MGKRVDSRLRCDVEHELKRDPRIDHHSIFVQVVGGVVRLSGSARTFTEKAAAVEAAHRVRGVVTVADDLQLQRAKKHDDEQIAAAAQRALEWDVRAPQNRVRATVANGEVRLEGEVHFLTEREDADHAVRHLAGVRGVDNRILVLPRSTLGDDVKRSIETALARHATREANHVSLSVTDGRVTLSGRVRSWAEKKLIIGAVRGTHGVRSVEDEIVIDP